MKKWLLTLAGISGIAALTIGCATSKPRKKALRFQVEEDSDLWVPANEAAKRWREATGHDITVSADGDIPIFFVEKTDCPLPPEFKPPKVVLGCSLNYNKPDAMIQLNQVLTQYNDNGKHLLLNLMHEMGHHLRGDSDHISNPLAIMSPEYNDQKDQVTEDDIGFICEKLECNLP